MIAYPGIWTPAGEVQCLSCHGPVLGFGRNTPTRGYEGREAPREAPRAWRCDGCGRPTSISTDGGSSVDELAELRDRVNDETSHAAQMMQTGGMCCAVTISLGGTCYLMVTIDEEAVGDYLAGEYKNEDDCEGEERFRGPADKLVEYLRSRETKT
jgi:hypothetical protein